MRFVCGFLFALTLVGAFHFYQNYDYIAERYREVMKKGKSPGAEQKADIPANRG